MLPFHPFTAFAVRAGAIRFHPSCGRQARACGAEDGQVPDVPAPAAAAPRVRGHLRGRVHQGTRLHEQALVRLGLELTSSSGNRFLGTQRPQMLWVVPLSLRLKRESELQDVSCVLTLTQGARVKGDRVNPVTPNRERSG